MKKDIKILKVEDVHLAIALEYNSIFKIDDWNVYLINNKLEPLELVLIVSKGFSKSKKTATMRRKLSVLPAKSFAKIEFISEEVLSLDNEFLVAFFKGNVLYEKTFLVKKNTVNEKSIKQIEVLNLKGVLLQ
jgi:hypothetical protein